MTAGTIYDCTIELPNTALTFLEGHRIRVDVTSSNYPRFNRNMNTGGAMYPNNNGDILVNAVVAENTIHTSSVNASRIVLPLVGGFPAEVSVNEISSEQDLFIYPNPVSDKIIIVNTISSTGFLRITDSKGTIIHEQKSNTATTEINLHGYASGIYTITFTDGKRSKTKRFIVR